MFETWAQTAAAVSAFHGARELQSSEGLAADILAYPKRHPPTEVPQPLHVLFISHTC